MENQNNSRPESHITSYPTTLALRVPSDNAPSINFHYETQEGENRERAIQSFT